jgi:hypothetical protein
MEAAGHQHQQHNIAQNTFASNQQLSANWWSVTHRDPTGPSNDKYILLPKQHCTHQAQTACISFLSQPLTVPANQVYSPAARPLSYQPLTTAGIGVAATNRSIPPTHLNQPALAIKLQPDPENQPALAIKLQPDPKDPGSARKRAKKHKLQPARSTKPQPDREFSALTKCSAARRGASAGGGGVERAAATSSSDCTRRSTGSTGVDASSQLPPRSGAGSGGCLQDVGSAQKSAKKHKFKGIRSSRQGVWVAVDSEKRQLKCCGEHRSAETAAACRDVWTRWKIQEAWKRVKTCIEPRQESYAKRRLALFTFSLNFPTASDREGATQMM